MSRERWLRTKALFQEALELDDDGRREFLSRVGDDDPERRTEIESMLAAHAESDGFLEAPPAEAAAEVLALAGAGDDGALPTSTRLPSLEGRRLGPYKIVRPLGQGGLGAVYLAEREEEFKKEVAIKLIRATVATPELARRFEAERQILANIDHPNIARLLDGGTTEEGLPYLVMEYVEGDPIDRFCDEQRMSLEERLSLFVEVCGAVAFAHRSLVVHCDLKPDNILVTPDGTPKLLDFGISKILSADVGDGPGTAAETGQRILTPDYASPEQLRGLPLTTTTDVYSLGVVLSELIAGTRPHTLRNLSIDQAARVVAESEPRRPSTAGPASRVRTGSTVLLEPEAASLDRIAAARGTSARRLLRQLSGDLDAIVLKALSRESETRYETIEAFAQDVRRHLDSFPVTARPQTVGYKVGRFIRRHRVSVTLAAAALVTALSFAGVVAMQSARLAAARNRAEAEAASSRVVSDFLQKMLTSADPFEGLGGDATVLEALNRAVAGIDAAFDDKPELEASVRATAGTTYLRLGRLDEAEKQLLGSLAIRRGLASSRPLDLARSLNSVALLHQERGAFSEAEEHFREALQIVRAAASPEEALYAETIAGLATVLHDRGDYNAAEPLYREALSRRRALYGPEHRDVATSLDDLANLIHEIDDLEVAEKMYRDALAIRTRLLGPEHPDVSISLNNVAAVLHDRDELDQAEPFYRDSLEMARRLFPGDHPEVATALNNLAALLHDRDDLAQAESLYRESLEMVHRLHPGGHPDVAASLNNLGALLLDRGEIAKAEALYRESLELTRRFFGDNHLAVAAGYGDLALALEEKGDLAGSEAALLTSLEIARRADPPSEPAVGFTLAALASVVCQQGETQRAQALYEDALAKLREAGVESELGPEFRAEVEACLAGGG